MSRFVLGFLVGALAMYWYPAHGESVVSDVVGWFQDTAADYGSSPGGRGSTETHTSR